MRVLMVDNYDSFTYNLVQYLGELGAELEVVRNDANTVDELLETPYDRVVVSPGPCTPNEAGISLEVIKTYAGKIPIFGVCLGHQAIGQAFGGKVVRAGRVMHGKTSKIFHDERGVFAGLPNPFQAARYHSLAIARTGLPPALAVTATADDGEIMAVAHVQHPVIGLQFHPESVLTEYGYLLLDRFLHGAAARADVPTLADGARASTAAPPVAAVR